MPHLRLHNRMYYRLFSTLNHQWTGFVQRMIQGVQSTRDDETGFRRIDANRICPWWFRTLHNQVQRRKKFVLGGSVMFRRFMSTLRTKIAYAPPTTPSCALSDDELCAMFLRGIAGGLLRPLEGDLATLNADMRALESSETHNRLHVFDYRIFYSSDETYTSMGGDGKRDPCLVRALFTDDGHNLRIQCIRDDHRQTLYTAADTATVWDDAKNRLYSRVMWVAQIYMHLANHLRLAPIAVSVWQMPNTDHWMFQLLHPFLSDLPFVNETWGANLILDEFTVVFAPDDRMRTTSMLRKASITTDDTRAVLELYTPCAGLKNTYREYSQVVTGCLRTFVEHVVNENYDQDDHVAHALIRSIQEVVNDPDMCDSATHAKMIDTLVWVLYEASLGHAIYHVSPHDTLYEQVGRRVAYGNSTELDITKTVMMALTFPESMCSLYPMTLDALGTFQLGSSVQVLRDVIQSQLEPYIRDTMCAPTTIICTHGH